LVCATEQDCVGSCCNCLVLICSIAYNLFWRQLTVLHARQPAEFKGYGLHYRTCPPLCFTRSFLKDWRPSSTLQSSIGRLHCNAFIRRLCSAGAAVREQRHCVAVVSVYFMYCRFLVERSWVTLAITLRTAFASFPCYLFCPLKQFLRPAVEQVDGRLAYPLTVSAWTEKRCAQIGNQLLKGLFFLSCLSLQLRLQFRALSLVSHLSALLLAAPL
jgi:hypothetical protein